MKSLVFAFLAAIAWGAGPMRALAQAPQPTPPAVAQHATRPLLRYLTATLHLTSAQATAVQRRLSQQPRQTATTEDLALTLRPVLTPEARQQLQTMQQDVSTYETLHYLAAQH